MEQFILEDMRRKLLEEEQQQALAVAGIDERLARLDTLLRAAEQKAIAWEQMGGLDPHVNVLRGPKWKVFLKRLIRKLTWFLIGPLVEQQNCFLVLAKGMNSELRESIGILKDLASQQRQALESLVESQKRLRGAHTDEDVFQYIDYGAFENALRGSQQEIRTRIRRYLDYFKPGERVVDLGCGRGEWLELLAEKGIDASGVDTTEKFVAICQSKGLDVLDEDMFHYLERQPDGSLDGITAIQVIEHIGPAALARLIQLSYRKLKLGGRIILETPNPMSVSMFTKHFLVDPTHIRPVHPTWLEYLLKAGNFTSVFMDYPEYAWVTDGSIPPLEGQGQDVRQFNRQIEYLNNFLYGSVDYAAIATKGGEEEQTL